MPFTIKKFLDHGTENPIVARLALQTVQILRQCNITKEFRDTVGELYLNSLQRKLLRCWEIEQRFLEEFNAAVAAYEPPGARRQLIDIPQVGRLEEECHNFVYEAKNYIRDVLKVVNLLYGTTFKEASEFSRGKKGGLTLVDWASKTFGGEDPRTNSLRGTVATVEKLVGARNAVEHPGGYSGILLIENFTLGVDGRLREPVWHREREGEEVDAPSSIRLDMDAAVRNLLLLGEEVVVLWAEDHFREAALMRVAGVPPKQRDPKCPVKYVVTVSEEFARRIAERGESEES